MVLKYSQRSALPPKGLIRILLAAKCCHPGLCHVATRVTPAAATGTPVGTSEHMSEFGYRSLNLPFTGLSNASGFSVFSLFWSLYANRSGRHLLYWMNFDVHMLDYLGLDDRCHPQPQPASLSKLHTYPGASRNRWKPDKPLPPAGKYIFVPCSLIRCTLPVVDSQSMSATSGGLGTITNPVFSILESDSNLSKSRSEQQFADPVFIPCI
ncbi:hypothetical protein EDD15DRAFT_2293661, partial [Pisolithus albus]